MTTLAERKPQQTTNPTNLTHIARFTEGHMPTHALRGAPVTRRAGREAECVVCRELIKGMVGR